jgi:hypothetical protein
MLPRRTLYAVDLAIAQSSIAEELAVTAPSRLKLCRVAAEIGGNHIACGICSPRLAVS